MESIKKQRVWIKLMEWGSCLGCHQMPERSFFICGYQFPVCARCTGALLGEIVSYILMMLRIAVPLRAALLLLSVMGADWFVQYIGLKESTNLRRFITGIMGGIGITFVYANLVRSIVRAIFRRK